MKDPHDVSASERGVVRVFTTDLEPRGDAAITPKNVHMILGDGVDLDPARVEVFPTKVLEGMGLSAYLQEGYGIPSEDLVGKSAALDALSGLVILIASPAFKGLAQRLEPNSGIRFIGAFKEPGQAPPKLMTPVEATEGALSPSGGSAHDPFNRHQRGWVVALFALLAAAALVLFAVL